MSAAPDGSIVRRNAPRQDLLAFEIVRKITKSDIEWMSSIVEQAMNSLDEIDMLIVMANYEGSDLGAMFDGHAMSVQTRSVAHIRRYAVVGAPMLARAMIAVSGAVTPVETGTFDLDDERAAWAWLDEDRPAGAGGPRTQPAEGAEEIGNPTPS